MRLNDLRYGLLSHILNLMETEGGRINCSVASQLTQENKDSEEEVIGGVQIETSITITPKTE